MPFEDGFFDAVISVNAIDHVNDFAETAKEIKRVLKLKDDLECMCIIIPKQQQSR